VRVSDLRITPEKLLALSVVSQELLVVLLEQ
jgi:hypothetical protein